MNFVPSLFRSPSLSVPVLLALYKQKNENQPDGSSVLILNQYTASKRTERGKKEEEFLEKGTLKHNRCQNRLLWSV